MTSVAIHSGIAVVHSYQCHSQIQNLGLKSTFLFSIETEIAQLKWVGSFKKDRYPLLQASE